MEYWLLSLDIADYSHLTITMVREPNPARPALSRRLSVVVVTSHISGCNTTTHT